MSLPLKRRIARAALLVAAAAPVIGMGANAASAAGLPEATNGLSGLSSPETIHNADGLVHKGAAVANEGVGNAAKTVMPTVAKTGKDVGPTTKHLLDNTNETAGHVVGNTAQQATNGGLPGTGSLTNGAPSL